MPGIEPIRFDILSYSNKTYQRDRLTAATKNRLLALGVDVRYIKTEAEGIRKLKTAEADKLKAARKTMKALYSAQDPEIMKKINTLALEIGLNINKSDDLDTIVYQLNRRIMELRSNAGDNESKQKTIDGYARELDYIRSLQKSDIDLRSSINFTANMNISFHGLY